MLQPLGARDATASDTASNGTSLRWLAMDMGPSAAGSCEISLCFRWCGARCAALRKHLFARERSDNGVR